MSPLQERREEQTRMEGKWVVITGASAGIGRACADLCASPKANLILLARRIEKLTALKAELETAWGVSVMIRQVDITDRQGVQRFAEDLRSASLYPDVLINNAGMSAGYDKLLEGRFEDWDLMIDTNIKGLLNISRMIIPLMVEKNRGHVVNIGSVAGHQVYPRGNVYSATKSAIRALTEAMNIDLYGTNIRVSSVSPGFVRTEFLDLWFQGDEKRVDRFYKGFEPLTAEDVAETVFFIVNAPEHVNVQEVLVMPTAQRNAYLVHREG
jgi:NADP-dependent 3-hydroxy acid dehydrogenase YdfG